MSTKKETDSSAIVASDHKQRPQVLPSEVRLPSIGQWYWVEVDALCSPLQL